MTAPKESEAGGGKRTARSARTTTGVIAAVDQSPAEGAHPAADGPVNGASDGTVPPARKRTGRRPGTTVSRAAILRSAQAKFGAHGFGGATIRAIAQDAGVDAALVHHFFLSKERLFLAAIRDALHPDQVREAVLFGGGGVCDMGSRLVSVFLGLWEGEETGLQMRSILRSAVTHDAAAKMLREFVIQEVLLPITQAAGGTQPETRASLAASQLVGLAMTRYIVELQPIASLTRQDVVDWAGPGIQRYLTGELPASAA